MKRLIVFDLDGTLAASKSPLDDEMASLLAALLDLIPVAVISGADWPQFEEQLLRRLPPAARLERLALLPTCGTKLYRCQGGWKKIYAEDFSVGERDRVIAALHAAVAAAGIPAVAGDDETIEDRGGQITFSALGQHAGLAAKRLWDPDFARRNRIRALLEPLLPGFAVHLGGATSIDITRTGVDKAYGVRQLAEVTGIPLPAMIFVGDALFPGGNDYPVEQAGVVSLRVRDPTDTRLVIATLIACLSPALRAPPSPAAPSAGR